jgi:pyridinium-3,5-biscarboxylic acid mononucleotide sulfurtransferase
LAYGENADDSLDFRPGAGAAKEFQIRAPLKEAGLTKEDVRKLARELKLPVSEKPASPCLSSRIPHGTPVSKEALSRIENGEEILKRLGFRIFRLRHHGAKARLEFAREELRRATDEPMKTRIAEGIQGCGYKEVEFAPEGYRSPAERNL